MQNSNTRERKEKKIPLSNATYRILTLGNRHTRKAEIHKIVIDSILGHSNHNDMDFRYNFVDDQDRLNAIKKLEEYRKGLKTKANSDEAIVTQSVTLKGVETERGPTTI